MIKQIQDKIDAYEAAKDELLNSNIEQIVEARLAATREQIKNEVVAEIRSEAVKYQHYVDALKEALAIALEEQEVEENNVDEVKENEDNGTY